MFGLFYSASNLTTCTWGVFFQKNSFRHVTCPSASYLLKPARAKLQKNVRAVILNFCLWWKLRAGLVLPKMLAYVVLPGTCWGHFHLESSFLLSGPGFHIWVGQVKPSSPLYWINGCILRRAASLPYPVWKGRAVHVWAVPVLTLLARKEARKRAKSSSATYPCMLLMEIILKMTEQLLEKAQSICLHMPLLWGEYSWWCE